MVATSLLQRSKGTHCHGRLRTADLTTVITPPVTVPAQWTTEQPVSSRRLRQDPQTVFGMGGDVPVYSRAGGPPRSRSLGHRRMEALEYPPSAGASQLQDLGDGGASTRRSQTSLHGTGHSHSPRDREAPGARKPAFLELGNAPLAQTARLLPEPRITRPRSVSCPWARDETGLLP